jgi:predicted Zn-dependent protease
MRLRACTLALSALVALLAGCAVNPVTGRPELVLRSTESERRLGAEQSQQVEALLGVTDDPELAAYVSTLGDRLAAHSPRQDVEYHFAVIDTETPNAFALPGGYVYVTRGLLALTNSEDELANVIGHEIGHVAARHSVQRETRRVPLAIITGIGAAATSVVSDELGDLVGGVGQLTGALVLAPYSRNQERQADEVGQRMAFAAGFDPDGMPEFMRTLAREEALMGGDPNRTSFLASHPSSPERARTTAELAAKLGKPAPQNGVSREQYLAYLDGLLVGPDAREGVFLEERFLHPDLGFQLRFPKGWQTVNTERFIAAQPESGDAVSVLELDEANDPLAAAREFRTGSGAGLSAAPATLRIHGLAAARGTALAGRAGSRVHMDLTWIAHGDHVYRITSASPASHADRRRETFRAVATSFRPLGGDLALVTEERLRLVRGRASETPDQLAKRTGSSWSGAEIAVANALPNDAPFGRALLLKITVAEPYRP